MERLIRMGVALGVGLTVGLERGWRAREAAEGSRIAGWRTFGLIGLAAGIWADIGGSNLVALGMALLAITVSLAVAYWRKSETSADRSATTLVAAIVTFALGGLAGRGHTIEAGAGAVVMTAMLSAKSTLHGWLKRLSEIELRAALQFLLISVVILPILPNRGFGPYDALNPYQIWLMVVFVAGLSFAGYAAMRIWGQQAGLMLTALLGGIVASTAIAFDFPAAPPPDRHHYAFWQPGSSPPPALASSEPPFWSGSSNAPGFPSPASRSQRWWRHRAAPSGCCRAVVRMNSRSRPRQSAIRSNFDRRFNSASCWPSRSCCRNGFACTPDRPAWPGCRPLRGSSKSMPRRFPSPRWWGKACPSRPQP